MMRCLTFIFSSLLFASLCNAAEREQPNILLVLCDDLGYGDLGCYGHDLIETPHIDAFAKQGLRLTDCYSAAPNCSPARAGLMTGRTPYRVGVYSWIPFLSPMHVRDNEITIAHLLKQAGYETCHVGKWHLNGRFNLPGQPQPNEMGFDYWFSTQNNALPNHRNPYNFVRNGIPVGPLEGFASHLVANEAINWLNTSNREKPFFMFVCFHEPHEPIATDPEYAATYRDNPDPSFAAHHGNITQMDAAFGRLLNQLEETNIADDTLIIFTSDNGPAMTRWHPHGSTSGLREYKGHLYEGGIRVPGIIRWPGMLKAGQTSSEPVGAVDFLPTLCEVAGVSAPDDRVLDGSSILPLLNGKEIRREKPLYWQFNYAKTAPRVVIRDGNWKLLAELDINDQGNLTAITELQMQQLKEAKLKNFELYNLETDREESQELSESYPEQLQKMIIAMSNIYNEVQAEGPVWPSWEWPRYEGKRIIWPDYNRRR